MSKLELDASKHLGGVVVTLVMTIDFFVTKSPFRARPGNTK